MGGENKVRSKFNFDFLEDKFALGGFYSNNGF